MKVLTSFWYSMASIAVASPEPPLSQLAATKALAENCTDGLSVLQLNMAKEKTSLWAVEQSNHGPGTDNNDNEEFIEQSEGVPLLEVNDTRALGALHNFNCSAGNSTWKRGWSQLKKDYCCQSELVGCSFNCSDNLSKLTPEWLLIKKSWCCQAAGIGCKNAERQKDERPCLTQETVLAKSSMFGGHVSPIGTPCVFGIDPRDEGYHCMIDNGMYGSFGWCYTNKDRSSWGACNQDCPLFGLAKVIGNRLKNVTEDLGDRIKHLEGQLEDLQKAVRGSVAGKVSAPSANSTPDSGDSTNAEGNAVDTVSAPSANVTPASGNSTDAEGNATETKSGEKDNVTSINTGKN